MVLATGAPPTTPFGTIDIQLYDDQAPITVANFLRYAGSGYYSNFTTSQGVSAVSFISRSVPGFVIQGGGYGYSDLRTSSSFIANYVAYSQVPKAAKIQNEFSPSRSNLLGTIAMAKVAGDPNSATSEWFINLANNGGTPPNGLDYQNGGFTVFGNVIDTVQDPGMSVVNAIASLPLLDATSPLTVCSTPCNLPMGGLDTVPVSNFSTTTGLDPSNLVSVISIPNVLSTTTIQGGLMTFTSDVDMTFKTAQSLNQTASQTLLQAFTPPPGETAQFSDGIFGFIATWTQGSSSRIVTLHNDDPATANKYYAYGPTSDNPAPHWYDFTYDGTTGAEFVGNEILLHFVDGQRGDNDTTPNSITHIGAPALVAPIPSSSSGGCTIAALPSQTTNNGDWVLISMFLAFVALVRRRARRGPV
ncbi:MAG: peptidylprolyl isomerase [Sulfuricaulis sp.]